MKGYQKVQVVAIGLCLSVLAGGRAEAFTFTRIADSNNAVGIGVGSNFKSFGQGFSTPWSHSNWDWSIQSPNSPPQGLAINNSGQVAFFADLKTGGRGLFINAGGSNKTVASNINSQFSNFGQGLSLNEKGEIAFFGNLNTGGQNILIGQGTTTNYTIIASTNGQYSSFGQGLSLNDSKEVAFFAALDAGGAEIFKSNGTATTKITSCSLTSINGSGVECPIDAQRPSISNDGTVAFTSDSGVFTSKDGVTTNNIMSDPGSFATGRYHDASINNSGRVVYRTGLNSWYNTAAILSSNQTNTSIIAGNTAPLHSVSRSPSINNNGEVAFMGEWGEIFGIFTGMPDILSPKYNGDIDKARADMLARDKVIRVGDTLFGSKVTALSMDRESMNDKCQIAFWAQLESGIEGIYRADPGQGQCQTNPLMPDAVHDPAGTNGLIYQFINQPGRVWYDPPSATGFTYKMASDSLFTSILNLPGGFDSAFTVSVGDTVLGQFTGGDSVNFVSLLGSGVKEFSITGISVDPTNPDVFPIKLDFDTDLASFDMYTLGYQESDPKKVPEPSSVLGLLAFGALGALTLRKRQQKLAAQSCR
jgi:hypothetical protein